MPRLAATQQHSGGNGAVTLRLVEMSRELDRDLLRIQLQQRAEATREKRRAVELERAKTAARRQLKVRPKVADEECKCRRLNPNKRRSPPSLQRLVVHSTGAGRGCC